MRLTGDVSTNPAWKIQVETKIFSTLIPKGAKKSSQKLFYMQAFPYFFRFFSLQPDGVRSRESISNFSLTLLADQPSLDGFEQMQQKICISEVWKWL